MKYHDFINHVQNRAGIESKDIAEKASHATLEILSQRLAGEEPQNLAAQLPQELQSALGRSGGEERFSLQQFYQKVAHKAGIDSKQAATISKAVITTVNDAVSPGELENVFSQLPDEYTDLLTEPER